MIRHWLSCARMSWNGGATRTSNSSSCDDLAESRTSTSSSLRRRSSVRLSAKLQSRRLARRRVQRPPAGTRAHRPVHRRADMVDRGHGSGFIRAFVDGLLAAGTPRVITDPDLANARAIRAYAKAGFREDRRGEHAGRPGAADGTRPMTTAVDRDRRRSHPAVGVLPGGARDHRPAGAHPLRDGPRADLHLRHRQAVARRGAERGELPAHFRLVYADPCRPRLRLLFPHLAGAAAGAVCAAAGSCRPDRGRLGNHREQRLRHQPLPFGNHLAGLFRRQHRQFGCRYVRDDRSASCLPRGCRPGIPSPSPSPSN